MVDKVIIFMVGAFKHLFINDHERQIEEWAQGKHSFIIGKACCQIFSGKEIELGKGDQNRSVEFTTRRNLLNFATRQDYFISRQGEIARLCNKAKLLDFTAR